MAPTSARRSIGAVLAGLREEFPDVSVSKIRFLEAEGLVSPERTASGYRQYSEADVERLRYILTAQRDRFWPLKVIREALDGLDRGLTVAGGEADRIQLRPPAVTRDPDVPGEEALRTTSSVRLTTAELADASGADDTLIADLVSFGLLRPDVDGLFAGESARTAAAARELTAAGIQARHLRSFRTAADREVGLIDYAVAAIAVDQVSFARACLALHTALVKDELARRA